LIAYLLAREFGVTPSTIDALPAVDVMRWWSIYADLSHSQKGAG